MTSGNELDLIRSTVRGLADDGRSDLDGLARLDLLGLLVEERSGGSGWLPVEAAVVAEELGRAVATGGGDAPESRGSTAPWVAVTLAAAALASSRDQASSPDLGDRLRLALGGSSATVAVGGHLTVEAGRASGTLTAVELAVGTTAVAVVGTDGSNHLVDIGSSGVAVGVDVASIDTTRQLHRLDLERAPVVSLGCSTAVRDAARVLVAATGFGSLRAALARLVPYLTDRVAFGAPIASFQAIQHRVVDLFLLETRLGVTVDAAARALASDTAGASALAAVAHALAVEGVPPALDECIQLTGGIGFTWEYPLHHEMRRAVSDGAMFGSARDSCETLLRVKAWA